MKLSSIAIALAGVLLPFVHAFRPPRDHTTNDYYVLQLKPATDPRAIAHKLGLQHEGPLGPLDDHHVFFACKTERDVVAAELKRRKRKRDVVGDSPDAAAGNGTVEEEGGGEGVLDGILFSQKQQKRWGTPNPKVFPDYWRAPSTLLTIFDKPPRTRDPGEDVHAEVERLKKEKEQLGCEKARAINEGLFDQFKGWRNFNNRRAHKDWDNGGDKSWGALDELLGTKSKFLIRNPTRDPKHIDIKVPEKKVNRSEPKPPTAPPRSVKEAPIDAEHPMIFVEEEEKNDDPPPAHLEKRKKPPMRSGFTDWLKGYKPSKPKPPLTKREIIGKLEIKDPEFLYQWYLHNEKDQKHSMHVGPLWLRSWTGKGVTVAIIDDGVNASSVEFRDNFNMEGSWNFFEHQADPTPRLRSPHGTRSAGVLAAGKNGICGMGIAYGVNVSGIRLLGEPGITAAEEAEAMSYAPQINDIYSCSWGPPDNGQKLNGPPLIVQRAIHQNILTGRGGKGSVYVFAAGNGKTKHDNCNFDGYTNSIYTMTISSVSRYGNPPPYAEECAANLVSTYSSGDEAFVSTVDLEDRCWDKFGGTSASAPLAAGVFALALEQNPELTWRDLQYIAILSASNDGLKDAERQGKRKFSHKYGFGKIDAPKLLNLAMKWNKVAPQSWFYTPVVEAKENIPSAGQLTKVVEVDAHELHAANFHDRLEHVTLTVTIKSSFRGKLSIDLVSPSGTISHLATPRPHDNTDKGFDDWTFMSVANWGERASGEWKIIFQHKNDGEHIGQLVKYSLQLYGTVWDKDNVLPLPAPGSPRKNMKHSELVMGKYEGLQKAEDDAQQLKLDDEFEGRWIDDDSTL